MNLEARIKKVEKYLANRESKKYICCGCYDEFQSKPPFMMCRKCMQKLIDSGKKLKDEEIKCQK